MNSGICGHEFLKKRLLIQKTYHWQSSLQMFCSQAAPYEHMATQKNCYFKTLLLKQQFLFFQSFTSNIFNQQLVLFSFPIDILSIPLYSVPCPHSLLSPELPPSQSCHQSLPNMSYGSGSSPDLLSQQLLQVCVPAPQYILSH